VNILALDTCLGACSAAVVQSGVGAPKIFGRFERRERQHAETIIPMIETVLAEALTGWPELDAIAVTSGPGSFTGVRVGVSTARGFALALAKPLIAANSLDVMARQAADTLDPDAVHFAVAVDARRGEVYFALYDSAGKALSEPAAVTPQQALSSLISMGAKLVVGSGAALVRDACEPDGPTPDIAMPDLQPDAQTLGVMALEIPPLEQPLRPLYLRPPDAKPQSGKAVERR